jgi:trigger factor
MKKRTVALMLCAMMAFGAAGCGAKETDQATEATESAASTEDIADSAASGTITSTPCASSAFDLRGSDYVTLCDYSAIPVTITGDYDVDDQKVKDYFKQMFDNYGPFYTADPDKTRETSSMWTMSESLTVQRLTEAPHRIRILMCTRTHLPQGQATLMALRTA